MTPRVATVPRMPVSRQVLRVLRRVWRVPLVRKCLAVAAGALIAWSCELWPEGPARVVCRAIAPLLGGAP